LDRHLTPTEFAAWEQAALTEFGFARVVSGPLVRSSYLAEEAAKDDANHFSTATSVGTASP
jgi:lipoate synthase